MRLPGKSPPLGRHCETHDLPYIPGESGCWYCVYGQRQLKDKPDPQPDVEPMRTHACHGCDAQVSVRSKWCPACHPDQPKKRACIRCGAACEVKHARICESCREDAPPASQPYDRARKAARHAEGLHGRLRVEYQGKTMSATEVARLEGVKPDALQRRLRQGLPIDQALEKARYA